MIYTYKNTNKIAKPGDTIAFTIKTQDGFRKLVELGILEEKKDLKPTILDYIIADAGEDSAQEIYNAIVKLNEVAPELSFTKLMMYAAHFYDKYYLKNIRSVDNVYYIDYPVERICELSKKDACEQSYFVTPLFRTKEDAKQALSTVKAWMLKHKNAK